MQNVTNVEVVANTSIGLPFANIIKHKAKMTLKAEIAPNLTTMEEMKYRALIEAINRTEEREAATHRVKNSRFSST